MRAKMIIPVTLLMVATGCQWLARNDAERRYVSARADDRACREQGFRWPGEAYVDCRRFRMDARQRERWQELQLAQHDPAELGISPAADTYRPIRAANFSCQPRTATDGSRFIDCGETDGS